MKPFLLFSALVISQLAAAQPSLKSRFDSLTAAYASAGFHGVVVVAKGKEVIYKGAYGFASLEEKIPHTTETEFKTESVGKMFTATAILQLVEEGKLNLSQTVEELLPELNIKNRNKITVEQLLMHTSGLQSPWSHPQWSFKKDYTKAEVSKVIEDLPLAFDMPGKEMYYSNSGYFILGWIIEKVTGKPFDDYFQQQFFSPLGMTRTRHLNDTVMPLKTGAQPYHVLSSKKFIRSNETVGRKASPAGGWISTASDLHRFMAALSTGKLLKPQTLKRMQTADGSHPKDSAYRFYAFGLETYKNQPVADGFIYGHNGGGAGFSVDAYVEEKTGYIVTSCTNIYQNSRPIAFNYLRTAMGATLQPINKPLTTRIYDLVDSVGIDRFVQDGQQYFDQLKVRPDPGMFAMVCEVMTMGGAHTVCAKWMDMARSYFPGEGRLWVISGDVQVELGNKQQAKEMYEKARDLGQKNNQPRIIGAAEEKLKSLER